jgi:hypothetical protein
MITPSHEYSRQGRVFVPSSRTSSWIPCTRNGRRTHPEAGNPGCCHRVVTAVSRREPRCSGRARRDPFAGSSDAPREIRTPTVQTDHKALNLAAGMISRSPGQRFAHSIRPARRSGRTGSGVCCHGVVTDGGRGPVVATACRAGTRPDRSAIVPHLALWAGPRRSQSFVPRWSGVGSRRKPPGALEGDEERVIGGFWLWSRRSREPSFRGRRDRRVGWLPQSLIVRSTGVLTGRSGDRGLSVLRSAPHMKQWSAPSGTRSEHCGQRSASSSVVAILRKKRMRSP